MKKPISGFLLLIVCAFSAFGQTGEARKFDEFGAGTPCDSYLAQADGMMVELGNNPNSRMYVIVYEGREYVTAYRNGEVTSKWRLPQYGLAKARIDSIKKLLKLRKIPLDNYVFVNGGFREKFSVEIWLVPPGAESPKPTPTLKKMKYRKGKPRGFCTFCC